MAAWREFYESKGAAVALQANQAASFALRTPAPATVQARRITARHESRRNQCGDCFEAKPCRCV